MRLEVKPVPQPKSEYVIHLSEREAKALCGLLGRCAGRNGSGPSQFFHDLHTAINSCIPLDTRQHYYNGFAATIYSEFTNIYTEVWTMGCGWAPEDQE